MTDKKNRFTFHFVDGRGDLDEILQYCFILYLNRGVK